MKNYALNFCLFLAITLASCSSYRHSTYFQGLDRNPEVSHKINNYSPTTIQTGDVLAMSVRSLNAEGSALFNSTVTYISGSADGEGASSTGYTVDQNGEIQLPLVHSIKVKGLTLAEAESVILKAISPYLKEPSIVIHIINFKITIMGDVGHQNVYSINSDRISIPQALSLAGGLTVSSKRDSILLVREINGERKFVNIDITSAKLFDSPYYYLKNNDMLYVEEGRAKFQPTSAFSRTWPIVLSVISLLLLSFEVYRNYK